jgi:hypothetical protein
VSKSVHGCVCRTAAVVATGLAIAALAACSGGTSSSSTAPNPILQPTAAPTTSPPTVTTPQGGPALTMFDAPSSFTCLTQDPTQAQVTIG